MKPQVIRGAPSEQELKALVLALEAQRGQAVTSKRPASRWNDRSLLLHDFPPAGRRGWRSGAGANG